MHGRLTPDGPPSRRATQIAMKDAPCEEPLWCLYGCMFPCCAAVHIRKKSLGEAFDEE